MFDLTDKKILVAGARSGIGRAVVRQLSEAGAKIAAVGRGEPAERLQGWSGSDDGSFFYQADLARPEETERVITEFVNRFGPPDAVVNCIGWTSFGHLTDTSDDDWRQVIDVNLTAAFNLLREAGSVMKEAGGAMVMISSDVSLRGQPGMAAYSVSKGGLNSLVRSAAVDLAPFNIRVNAVAPGVTLTDRVIDSTPEGELERIGRTIPLGRLAEPDDIAAAVLFLISDHSKYITGHILPVDGGRSAV